MPRLNRARTKLATDELLWILVEYPDGLPTSALVGTDRFHGGHTLSPRQIARLLRTSGLVDEQRTQHGIWWKLKGSPAEQKANLPPRPAPRKTAEEHYKEWLESLPAMLRRLRRSKREATRE